MPRQRRRRLSPQRLKSPQRVYGTFAWVTFPDEACSSFLSPARWAAFPHLMAESGSGPLPPLTCEGCALGKAHRACFGRERDPDSHATVPLQRVHADLCGPVTVRTQETEQQTVRASLDGGDALYLSTIIDEKTRRVWGALLRTKGEAAAHVMQWVARVEKQSGRSVQEFHTDGGKEYLSLKEYFKARGIVHSVTQPYTPQHNGIAERMNRSLFEMVRAMLQHARLPPAFWEEAMLAAIFTRNRCLTSGAPPTATTAADSQEQH
jgi:transposase InsO family protein